MHEGGDTGGAVIVFFEKKELGRTSVGCQFGGEVLGVVDLAARDEQLGAVGEAEIRGGHLCEAAMTVVSALLWLKIDPTYPLDSGGGNRTLSAPCLSPSGSTFTPCILLQLCTSVPCLL